MKKVITYGTFDLLHQGHINILKNAKKLGDYLIVGVTSENYDKYRGKLNVQQSVLERIENIKKTGIADEILVEEYEGQKIDDIRRLGVDVFAIGSDWIGRFDYLKEYCDVIYLERTKGISSTQIRNSKHPIISLGIVGVCEDADEFMLESKFVSGINVEYVFDDDYFLAKDFCRKNELVDAFTNFQEMLKRLNAIYITSRIENRYSFIKEALSEGVNVLCESPLSLSSEEVEELFEIAQEKRVILFDAQKTAYCPGYKRMISCSKSGKIGDVVNVESTITKIVKSGNVYDSTITRMISHAFLPIFDVLGYNYTTIDFVKCHQDRSDGKYIRLNVIYDNSIALANIGINVKSENSLIISGTRGHSYSPSPWWKTNYFELRYENSDDIEKNFYKFLGHGHRYEIVEFINRITQHEMNEVDVKRTIEITKVLSEYAEKIMKIEDDSNCCYAY